MRVLAHKAFISYSARAHGAQVQGTRVLTHKAFIRYIVKKEKMMVTNMKMPPDTRPAFHRAADKHTHTTRFSTYVNLIPPRRRTKENRAADKRQHGHTPNTRNGTHVLAHGHMLWPMGMIHAYMGLSSIGVREWQGIARTSQLHEPSRTHAAELTHARAARVCEAASLTA